MGSPHTILVLGARSFVGASLTAQLIASGYQVRAISRSWREGEKGQDKVSVTLTPTTDWLPLLNDITAVFVCLPIGPDEAEIGESLARAIRRSNVRHLVHLSVLNSAALSGIPHFASKGEVQAHLAGTGRMLTTLACNHFFQNDVRFLPSITGEYGPSCYPLPYGSIGVHAIDARDIATAAVNAFRYPDRFAGRFALAGETCVTASKAAALYEHVLGKPVGILPDLAAWDAYWAGIAPTASDWLTADMRAMWEFTGQFGCLASSDDMAQSRLIVGAPLRGFEDFVQEIASVA